MKEPRDIEDVLNAMLKEVPNEHEFHKRLLWIISDVWYQEPEGKWGRATRLLAPEFFKADNQEPWLRTVLSIWMGEEGSKNMDGNDSIRMSIEAAFAVEKPKVVQMVMEDHIIIVLLDNGDMWERKRGFNPQWTKMELPPPCEE